MYDAQPQRGEKHTCQSCEAKFYDLGRTPMICPKCGTEFIEPVRPPPTVRQPRRSWAAKQPVEPTLEAESEEKAVDDEGLLDSEDEEVEEDEGEEAAEAEE